MDFPVLLQEVQEVNKLLVKHFGIDSITGQAMWRVVWSDDQYEKRLSTHTKDGFQLLYPEVMELPKYPWVKSRWTLERLVLIPDIHVDELPTQKMSYEPMYPFENAYTHDAIKPSFEACKFVIDSVYAVLGKKSMRKYVDDEESKPVEAKEARIAKLQEELFGDESSLLGRTITGEAVAYTGEPKITSQTKE